MQRDQECFFETASESESVSLVDQDDNSWAITGYKQPDSRNQVPAAHFPRIHHGAWHTVGVEKAFTKF